MAGPVPSPARAPALAFAPERLLQAQGIAAAIFDVDGVLTDGRLYYGPDGEAMKVLSLTSPGSDP